MLTFKDWFTRFGYLREKSLCPPQVCVSTFGSAGCFGAPNRWVAYYTIHAWLLYWWNHLTKKVTVVCGFKWTTRLWLDDDDDNTRKTKTKETVWGAGLSFRRVWDFFSSLLKSLDGADKKLNTCTIDKMIFFFSSNYLLQLPFPYPQ